MRKSARILAFAACAVLLLSSPASGPAFAEGTRVSGGWNYVVRDGEAHLQGCNPPFPEMVAIPFEVDGYTVREAKIIPLAVLNDGRGFESREVIQAVEIPAGVRKVDDLGLLPGLMRVEVEEGNERYASYDGVLYSADGTTLILCPRRWDGGVLYVPDSVTAIGEYAFLDCELESLVLPEGLKEIGKAAFEFCALTGQAGLYLPDELVSIGSRAFFGAQIGEIHVQHTLQNTGFHVFDEQKIIVHPGTYLERYAQVNGYDYELCTSCENAEYRLAPASGDLSEDDPWAGHELSSAPAGDLSSAPAGDLSVIPTPLGKGDKGEGVRRLQVALIEANFLYGEDDGVYGSGTVAAVKALQKKAGRKQTGEFSKADLKSLEAGLVADFKPQSKASVLFYDGQQQGNMFTFRVRNTGSTSIDYMMTVVNPCDKEMKRIKEGGKIVSWELPDANDTALDPGESYLLVYKDLSQEGERLEKDKSLRDVAYLEIVSKSINNNPSAWSGRGIPLDKIAKRLFPVTISN